MYTRCPSCRAEISFEPPVNATSLPDGYKHKIKCPSCGVTIAVKIPRLENTVQPVVEPQAPVAPVAPVETNDVATNNYTEEYTNDTATEMSVAPKAKKQRFGGAANTFAMIWSLLLTGFFVVAFLYTLGTIPAMPILEGIQQYDAISTVIAFCQPGYFAEAWASAGPNLLWYFVPVITLLFAFIQFIVSFSCLCAGKYSKGYNAIWTLLIFTGTALSLVYPIMFLITSGLTTELDVAAADALVQNIMTYVENGAWIALIVAPALGFISFLTALCSLGVKNPNKRSKKARE